MPTIDDRTPYRLSDRYLRMAAICRDYAEASESDKVRDQLLEMADVYGAHAVKESDKEVKSNAVPPPPSTTQSAFRFADLGRRPGLGAQQSEYGSD